MLKKKFRLVRKRDFDSIFKNGKTYRGDLVLARIMADRGENSRIAVVVSKKVSLKATIRNTAKRRIRSIMAKYLPDIISPSAIVIVVKKFTKDDKISLARDIEKILVSARLLKRNV